MSQSNILNVEDDSNDALLLQQACRKAAVNSKLVSVNDGDEAIAYLEGEHEFGNRTRFPLPDLMLLDLKLPRLSGFQVLVWLRENEKWRHLPVIVLSSSIHDADVRRAYALGANSYLVKPVAFESLVQIVKMIHQYWLTLNVQSEHLRPRGTQDQFSQPQRPA